MLVLHRDRKMKIDNIREMLPQLSQTVYGKPLVYLDNSATSLRPATVVGKWVEMSENKNANIHRAVHALASVATEEFESTRRVVASFIGAQSAENVIFTSGTTTSVNLLASSFGELCIGEGDEILIAECEHHSDIVPWQLLCERRKARIKVIPVLDDGRLDLEALPSLITPGKTKIACVAHISNVLGRVNPIEEIVRICHSKNCAVLVDGAQGIVHNEVNVSELGCDFYAFSGHKIYAAPGTGVLYVSPQWLHRLPPYMGGGEMIHSVSWCKTTFAEPPYRFEAGTQNIAGVPTLKPALEFAAMTKDREIEIEYTAVLQYVYSMLKADRRIRLYGEGTPGKDRTGIFSFTVQGAHHEDLALLLDKMGVAVRSGQMCAEPLMDRFGVTGMVRASFAPYNTMQEAEFFIESLRKAIAMLQ